MKRIISLITAITLLLALVVCNVPTSFAAKDKLHFSLTNAAGNNNEEITVELQISNNPGLYAFYFMLYYDTDALILREYKLCAELEALGSLATTEDNVRADEYKGPVAERVIEEAFPEYEVDPTDKSMKLLIYEIDDVTNNFTFNGTAITLTFQIMGTAEAGDYRVGLIPDIGSIINIDAEDVEFTWNDSIVRVGSTDVPAEKAPEKASDETQKVETTETTNNDIVVISPDETTPEDTTPTVPVETFVGEDGTTYYENEAGETVVYNEEDFAVNSDSVPEEDTSDISVDSEKTAEEEEKEQKNNMTLYIIIAAILILIAVAGVLASFIFKTKKAEKEDSENK